MPWSESCRSRLGEMSRSLAILSAGQVRSLLMPHTETETTFSKKLLFREITSDEIPPNKSGPGRTQKRFRSHVCSSFIKLGQADLTNLNGDFAKSPHLYAREDFY